MKEIRKTHTWFHSGNDFKEYKKGERPNAGISMVVSNEIINYVVDAVPINDRIMLLTLNADLPINIIGLYNNTAMATLEEKEETYRKLQRLYNKYKQNGPTYIMGDWNVRVQKKNRRGRNNDRKLHTGPRKHRMGRRRSK